MTATFRKGERLCSRKAIETLFEKGRSFLIYPVQVVWTEAPSDIAFPAQMAVSVPKKYFKRAVKRNIIKRRIREAYRLNKNLLYEKLNSSDKRIIFIMIYKGDTVPDYPVTEKTVKEVLVRLGNNFS